MDQWKIIVPVIIFLLGIIATLSGVVFRMSRKNTTSQFEHLTKKICRIEQLVETQQSTLENKINYVRDLVNQLKGEVLILTGAKEKKNT